VARLDVSLLQDNLIAPILGIADPRRDKRIDFVGGIRGLAENWKSGSTPARWRGLRRSTPPAWTT
jgi:uncharacterized protein (DUF1015 family)